MPTNNLQQHMQRLQQFANNLQQTGDGIVKKYDKELLALQKDQLSQGINSRGNSINPPYRPFTIEQKKQRSGLAGEYRFVTYFDTGGLYAKLQLIVQGGKFTITANTFKFAKAEQRSGNDTFGLNKESRIEARDYIIAPELIAEYRKSVMK
jgi:hypothetical protein